MKRLMGRWILLVALLVMMTGSGVMYAAPLHQSSTLDQDNENDDSLQGAAGDYKHGQTFTSGRSGMLDRIELSGTQGLDGGGQVGVQITSVNQDGTPTGNVLGSGSFDSSSLPSSVPAYDWVSLTIEPPVHVTAGVQYAIVLSQHPDIVFLWKQTPNNAYPRGKLVASDEDGAWSSDDYYDNFFRTYVLTLPTVPTCQGKTATIYVKDGKIVGGPDNGKIYKGKLNGTVSNDVIVGTGGKDSVDAKAGNDTICGLGGDDKLMGDDGNDVIDGGSGNDTLKGSNGDDWLLGGDGDDKLDGDTGNDMLDGGAGKDFLDGDDGNDTLTGGRGPDRFKGGDGTDTATDYNVSEGDTRESIP